MALIHGHTRGLIAGLGDDLSPGGKLSYSPRISKGGAHKFAEARTENGWTDITVECRTFFAGSEVTVLKWLKTQVYKVSM